MAANLTGSIRVAHVATVDLTVKALLLPQLTALRDEGYDVSAISAPGPFVPAIEAAGVRHVAWINATRTWDPRADLRAFAELVRILRRERFDLVHTHNAKPGAMGRIAARLLGTPCVVNTIHGFDATAEDRLVKRAAFMTIEWLAARCSDLELYQGADDMVRARRLRIAGRRKAAFLGNGTDLVAFAPGRLGQAEVVRLHDELGIREGELVVGMVGRLVAEKGYREFFAAAGGVRAERRDVRFVAVGERDLAKADAISEDEIERARDDVIFTGWRDDAADMLALFDVFVLPSWREGVPRSAVEAAALGIPLVLSDIPGCRQVARHGIEGFLVPVRRADLLAQEIARLVSDADLRRRMGAAARARAVARLDERQVIATILDRYRRLLARTGLAAPATAGEAERVLAGARVST